MSQNDDFFEKCFKTIPIFRIAIVIGFDVLIVPIDLKSFA